MRASEIARIVGSHLEGEDRELSGAGPLETAAEGELSFAAAAKALEYATRSRAGCLIVPQDFPAHPTACLIRHPQPRAAFAQALAGLYPPVPLEPGVHPTAVIDPGAQIHAHAQIGPLCSVAAGARIGARTRVGSGCHIANNAAIGEDCLLHANVSVYERVTIGNRVVLHSGCVLGSDGFGFVPHEGRWVKFPQVGRVIVEDDVEIGAGSCVDRAALGVTRIGSGTKLDNLVHVGHNCDIGRNVVVAAQTGFSGGVSVGDGAVIGGQVGIGDKARIEAGAILGSGSGVLTSKVVRAGEPMWGVPARPLKQHLEQLAHLGKIADLRKEIRRLAARVQELESSRESKP
jgi:UDP-3-O-[3-hydroxymyristoyl] glucosamine N-acyltransferase